MIKHVIINDMKVVDIEPYRLPDEAGKDRPVARFEDAYNILDAWMQQDPTRRGFRYTGSDDSTSPCSIFITWISNDSLIIEECDPFWSPSTDTVNGYDLDVLAASLPVDTLKYGDMIGEEL